MDNKAITIDNYLDYFRSIPTHPWWGVKSRIITAPPEYHALRAEKFKRDRENFERNRFKDANARRMPCGCVVALGDYEEKTNVHYCPTHWAERKNKYASAR